MSDRPLPIRIQRQRTKGWRMPENTVYVGRPTKWGNPYAASGPVNCSCRSVGECTHMGLTRQDAVDLFRQISLPAKLNVRGYDIEELRGKNLACWCPLDQPCHADVLLEVANG